MSEKETISVFGREETGVDRGSFNLFKNFRFGNEEVDINTLQDEINKFLEKMHTVIENIPKQPKKGFNLETIEIHAEVSAKGTLSLLGTGGEVGGGGGIKFILKKNLIE